MYLIFKSVDANTVSKKVCGAELAVDRPTYIKKVDGYKPDHVKDLVYLDVDAAFSGRPTADRDRYIKRIFNNIGKIQLSGITVSQQVEIGSGVYESIIKFEGGSTISDDRTIPPEEWNDVVGPSWYRVAHAANIANV